MKFSGSVAKGVRAYHYWIRLENEATGEHCKLPLCHGTIYEMVGAMPIDMSTKFDHSYGWGYEGPEAELTSINMLGLALGLRGETDKDDAAHGGLFPVLFDQSGAIERMAMPAYCDNIPALIKKLYQKFTTEIVANFGDSWEMTTEEILEWIKKNQDC